METSYLKEFLVLAKLGSSYAAAEQFYISQSTLIRHIQSLEEELGMPLFYRTRKGFILNEAGEVFLPGARKILSEQERCISQLQRLNFPDHVVRLASDGRIIDLLIDFKKENPEFVIDYRKPDHPEEELVRGNLDVAFLSDRSLVSPGITAFPFYDEEVLVMLYEGHPLYDRDNAALEDLHGDDIIGLSDDLFADHREFDALFAKAGFTMSNNITVPVPDDLTAMVREKMGIAFLHGIPGKTVSSPGTRILPVRPKMDYRISLCCLSGRTLSRGTLRFIDFAKKWRIRKGLSAHAGREE